MAEQTEVRTKLTMNDQASTVLGAVKAGFQSVNTSASQTHNKVMKFLRDSATTAVGFQFDRGIQSLKALGDKAWDAAMAQGKNQKAIAGSLMLLDRTGASYETLQKKSVEYESTLQTMGIKAGVSATAVMEAFDDLASRSNKTPEAVMKLTENIVNASKITPGGLEAITQGFAAMEMGLIKAKNPVVTIVKTMGVLKGNASEVAAQMKKMKPEEAMKLGEKAIERFSAKAKNLPLGYGQAIQSMKDIRTAMLEMLGGPMVKAVTPMYREFQKFFLAQRGDIDALMGQIGTLVGEGLAYGVKQVKEGLEWMTKHSGEVRKALLEGAAKLKDAVGFMADHKDAFILAGQAYMGLSIGNGAVSMGRNLASGAKSMVPMSELASGMAGGGWLAVATTGAAFVAAMAASKAVVDEWTKLMKESKNYIGTPTGIQDNDSRRAKINRLSQLSNVGHVWTEEEAKEVERLKIEINTMTGVLYGLDDQKKTSAWLNSIGQAREKFIEIRHGLQQFGELTAGPSTTNKSLAGSWKEFGTLFQDAVNSGNAELQNKAVEVFVGTQALHTALITGGGLAAKGIDKFIELIAAKDPALAELLKQSKDALGGVGKSGPPQINLNGGQTFNIKQEFKDADNDRVLVAFRRDLVKSIESRRVAGVGSPFAPR